MLTILIICFSLLLTCFIPVFRVKDLTARTLYSNILPLRTEKLLEYTA